MAKDLFSENDKQILADFADTIDSGLMRISDALPHIPDPIDYAIQICEHGDNIERGLNRIGKALELLAQAIEDKK